MPSELCDWVEEFDTHAGILARMSPWQVQQTCLFFSMVVHFQSNLHFIEDQYSFTKWNPFISSFLLRNDYRTADVHTPFVRYVGNLGSSIGNDNSRFSEVCTRCFPNVGKLYNMMGTQASVLEMTIPDLGTLVDGTFPMLEYTENLCSSIGNDNSRLWDISRWCFPNVGKLYSMLGTQAPALEMTIPDLGMSVDGTFPMLEYIWNLRFSIGNDNFRLQMVFSQCWKVVQYIGNLGSSIGNDNSRYWDVCRRCFSNVGKLYSMLGTQVPVLEMTIPDHRLCFPSVGKLYSMLGTYVPILEKFNPDHEKSVDCPVLGTYVLISEIINPDLGTFIDCAFPILESCKVCWEPKIQYLKRSFLILGYPLRVLF